MHIFFSTALLWLGYECGVGLASPTEEFMVYYSDRLHWVIEVTFPGTPGHSLQFVEDYAGEKLVSICFM